ncbi:uncharacterized protein LOC128998237 isoform X2 [Macrosteles quadrilineatus]|nr:uncharacterized protein LOC128998237 isoform X2 [Macrosteles quadrilineatus]
MANWGEESGIEYWTMSPDRAEEGLKVLRDGFFTEEAFCCNVGIDRDIEGQRELEKLCLECALDGVSIIAVDKETNQIVGVCYNKLQTAPPPGQKSFFEEFRDTKCKTKTAKALISMMMQFDSLVDLYDKYDATSSFELMFLGTHPDCRKRGVASGCVKSSLSLVKTLTPPKPSIMTAIFTSPFSIRVGQSLNFDKVIHVPMEETIYEGKPFSEHPKVGKNHPGSIVMVKRL